MRIRAFCIPALLSCLSSFGQTTPDVGSGSPSAQIQASFVNSYYRNGFSNLVSLPPIADVKKLGTTGLVQEYADASKNQTNKYALIKANASAPVLQGVADVLQMYPGMYSYYSSVGPTTAGYPVGDTMNCPGLLTITGTSCQYQLFDKPYALFVYLGATTNGTTFATRDPFYTKWQNLGGIGVFGPPVNAEQTVTSVAGTKATLQVFDKGAVVDLTSGALSGRILGIGLNIYPLYASLNAYTGFLGLPTADEITLATGVHRQTFEGGAIEYVPGSPATVRYPVQSVSIIANASPLRLNLGDTRTLQAALLDIGGNPLTDRTVAWTTSNQRVASIQASGLSAIVTAAGGGSATITASSEGKISTPLTVIVSAPCCAAGDGAPTPAIQQAFVDAINRNHIQPQLPIAGPVTRSGAGYIQAFQDAAGVQYLATVSDRTLTGYVVSGDLLAQYLTLGGPAGALGFPVSDRTAGGRQLFENQAALAGSPPLLVSGSFLTKWAAIGYETGSAGSPTAAVAQVLTFRATLGQMQTFSGGLLLAALTGNQSGKVYFVSGTILAAYNAAGGASGQLGLPLNDEFASAGARRQDFEGGYVDYTSGSAAVVHPTARTPLVSTTPTSVVAGGRVRVAVGGFSNAATLKISQTGQADFTIQTDSGAYSWEIAIPASTKSAVISIHAVDAANAKSTADGSYAIRSTVDAVLQLTKVSGDSQSGLPGAMLPQALSIAVKDDSGNAAPGIPVTFLASPGAQIIAASATTDANGSAQAILRLPSADGVALVTVQAGRQVATFSAQATHSSLAAFPAFTSADNGFTSAIAAILRYHQNRGDLPAPNGFADPNLIGQFLKAFCALDALGAQICDGFVTSSTSGDQFANLWRAAAFAGNSVTPSIESADLSHVRDLIAQGVPVLLVLSQAGAAGHYVVATGVSGDGSITIMDPSATLPRVNLNDYLAGAKLVGAVRLIPQAPKQPGFLLAGDPTFDVFSASGACGANLDLPAANGSASFRFRFCDGNVEQYQLTIAGATGQLTLTDLGSPANRVSLSTQTAFIISKIGVVWGAAPLVLSFSAQGVTNGASFTPDLAPGGIFSIFGSGLAGQGNTTVEVGGSPVTVVSQSPFQVNAVLPLTLSPGQSTLKVTSPYGTAQQPIAILNVAPAIFQISAQAGAVTNLNGSLNTPDNPAARGGVLIIYCTGLGAVAPQGSLQVAQTAVTAILNGSSIRPSFAGLTPGFVGLYQVNVPIPIAIGPGLNVPLTLKQGSSASNPVLVTIQ